MTDWYAWVQGIALERIDQIERQLNSKARHAPTWGNKKSPPPDWEAGWVKAIHYQRRKRPRLRLRSNAGSSTRLISERRPSLMYALRMPL